MKKIVFLVMLSVFGLSAFSQTNVDSLRIDSAKYISPTIRDVYVSVFGLLPAGVPATLWIEKGVCPSYNSLGQTTTTAINAIGNSSYLVQVSGLTADSCIKLKAVIGGGNANASSNVFSFTNTGSAAPCNFQASIAPSPDSICDGTTLMLIALPLGGTYQWMKDSLPILGATLQTYDVNIAGKYTVSVKKNSCIDTSNLKLVKNLPSPIINSYYLSGNNNLTINGHFKYPIIVKINNITYATAYADTNQIFVANIANINSGDILYVQYTNNNCVAKEVLTFTGVEENIKNEESIYPNPATDYINVVNSTGKELTICNLFGQILLSRKIVDNNEKIYFNLSKGVYLCTFKDKLKIASIKLIVN